MRRKESARGTYPDSIGTSAANRPGLSFFSPLVTRHLSLVTEFRRSIPNTELNGHKTQRLANTTNITFHGIESEALLILLDKEGICASSGSACLADSDEPSHVT